MPDIGIAVHKLCDYNVTLVRQTGLPVVLKLTVSLVDAWASVASAASLTIFHAAELPGTGCSILAFHTLGALSADSSS